MNLLRRPSEPTGAVLQGTHPENLWADSTFRRKVRLEALVTLTSRLAERWASLPNVRYDAARAGE
jgi:hypothetical protein